MNADPRGEWPVVTVERFPYGLRCDDCNLLIWPGKPFSRALWVEVDGDTVEALVCAYCGDAP